VAGPAWYDDDAGPVVRPYALTGGRTRYAGADTLDMVALIVTRDGPETEQPEPETQPLPPGSPPPLWSPDPEHEMILALCRTPLSVVEIASEMELIEVRRPAPVARFPGERVLKEVIDGIRAL
jgi:hypothetical protein